MAVTSKEAKAYEEALKRLKTIAEQIYQQGESGEAYGAGLFVEPKPDPTLLVKAD